MKLTDENGQEYEFKKGYEYDDVTYVAGLLKPIEKEWPQEGDDYWYIYDNGEVDYQVFCGIRDGNDKFLGMYRTKEEAELARDLIKLVTNASDGTKDKIRRLCNEDLHD